MNICYVAPDVPLPYFRGSSTHVYEVSKNLAALGHNVFVVSRRLSRLNPRWERLDGFAVYRTFQGLIGEPPLTSYHHEHVDEYRRGVASKLYGFYLGSFRALQLGVEVAAIMRQHQIDVVLERETGLGVGAVCSELMGVPLVLEVIGGRYSGLSFKQATRIMTYSRRMMGRSGTDTRLSFVSTAVDTGLFSPNIEAGEEVRRKLKLEGQLVVGYVGTFPVWHGTKVLLLACKELFERGIEFKLLMVGPYFQGSQEFAKSLGIEDNMKFTGPVPYESVPQYINACDILCAPYFAEASAYRSRVGLGAPLKVMEYMSCMKPVISTTSPPIPDILENGIEGILTEPGDVKGLEDAIARLLGDEAARSRLGESARRRATRDFSWGNLAKTIASILEESTKN